MEHGKLYKSLKNIEVIDLYVDYEADFVSSYMLKYFKIFLFNLVSRGTYGKAST
jgi:hypothetical protein